MGYFRKGNSPFYNDMEFFKKMIVKRLIPEVIAKKSKRANSFGVVLKNGETLRVQSLAEIRKRTSLSPIFFVISEGDSLDISRRYARCLGERLVFVSSLGDAVRIISETAFTVSESISGCYISFFAGTPVYLEDSSELSRSFIKEIKTSSVSEDIFIPYSKNKTEKIGNSVNKIPDFALATKKLRADFSTKLSRVFYD